MNKRFTLKSHVLHKWIGLLAALWLAVLGATGFVLDHREWNWVWQTTVNSQWLPQPLVDESNIAQYRLFQVKPDDNRRLLTGGPTGLWWSDNRGEQWHKTQFGTDGQPGVWAIFEQPSQQATTHKRWQALWLATNNGLWLSTDNGQTATQVALSGKKITAITGSSQLGQLIGIEDRSRLFRFDPLTRQVEWQLIAPPSPSELEKEIDLSRLVHDLHFGRGLVNPTFDLLWSDITGIAICVLAISGFLFFWLPKRWKKKKVPARHKKSMIRNLYRIHAIFAGVVIAIPLLYLSVTGIILDHSKALRPWLKETKITPALQPPTYQAASWYQLIYGIATDPSEPQQLLLGSRAGLFVSNDDGRSWTNDPTVSGFVWTLRQQGNQLMIGGMGAPNRVQSENGWTAVKGSGHMPTDMSVDDAGSIYWKSKHGVMQTSLVHPPQHIEIAYPTTNRTPLYYLLDGLHTGLLIHPSWPWINDLFALCAILLVITGLKRWWRHRWL